MPANWPNCLYDISNNATKKQDTTTVPYKKLIEKERFQDKCAEEVAKIINAKLKDPNSSLSKYLLKKAKAGKQKVHVGPLRALSIAQYYKYWKGACEKFQRTNFLLSSNSISNILHVKIKPEQNHLVISWNNKKLN